MLKPMFVTGDLGGHGRVNSLYKVPAALVNVYQGELMDIDLTDTSVVGKSLGFNAQIAGSLKLASITTQVPNELGIALVNANATGVPLVERMLGVATNYFTIPLGLDMPVYMPVAGDVIATDQYVGALPADVGANGLLDPTLLANYGSLCGIYQGRFRLTYSTDKNRAQVLGYTASPDGTSNKLAIFRFL